MDWKLFFILLGIGVVLFVVYQFYMQRQVAYMSILLYKQGDADSYLKELDSKASRFFFNKKLRTLMAIDANLMKQDNEQLEKLFALADEYRLRPADEFIVLQKKQTWLVSQKKLNEASTVFQQMNELFDQKLTDKQKTRFEEQLKEARYIHAINVKKDGSFAAELMEQARSIKDVLPAGMYFVRAAQSYYLKEDKKRALEAVRCAADKLKGTPYASVLSTMVERKDLTGILDLKI